MRILLLFLALAGCATTSDEVRARLEAIEAPFRVPGTVAARLGEEVRVNDLSIRPLEVLEDSRCPIDVTCIWAGRVRVRVAISGAGEPVMEIGQFVLLPNGTAVVLTAVAPPRWQAPPPGVDASAPARFAFSLGRP